MADNHKKKLLERPWMVFLLVFLSLAIVLTILAVIDGKGSPIVISTYFLYGGLIAGFTGFLFLNRGSGDKWDGYGQSEYMKNDGYFKKVRAEQKPLERIVWPVIFAAALLVAIGYFLSRFLAG
ncbi:MAG: hypothetical protein WCC12_01500 [Anaerolineales bacterium]